MLHEGFIGTTHAAVQYPRPGIRLRLPIEKETKATKLGTATAGWLGITDKYWVAAVIPEQAQRTRAPASTGRLCRLTYEADFGRGRDGGDRARRPTSNRVFAGAKEATLIDAYQALPSSISI